MSTAQLRINFGDLQSQIDKNEFSITTYIQKENVSRHQQELSKKIGKYRLPMVVLETSEDLKELDLSIFSSVLLENFESQSIIRNNKNYQMFEFKSAEWKAAFKKIQNLLKNITDCNNTFSLKMTFCNLSEKCEAIKNNNNAFAIQLLENACIEANIGLDSNFINSLIQTIQPISPGFSQSPLIGLMEIFGGLEAQFEFQSPSELNKHFALNCSKKLISYSQPKEQEKIDLLQKLRKNKEEISMYINFGKIGYIHLKGNAIIWSYFLCMI